ILAAAGAVLDERLDVGEAENRRQARAGHPPVRPLALPIREPDALQPLDRLRRRRGIELRERQRVEGRGRADPAVLHLVVGPRLGELLPAVTVEDPLVAVPGEPGLHEELDVAVLVGTRDVEPPWTALRCLAKDLVDEPEADVAGLARA